MMYNNNFVVAIKVDGKVLRDSGGLVRLPFGSEYSILLKNLDSRKAVASVSVDGEDVLNSTRIIVPANKSVELKGKMLGKQVKHKFKFIERTKEISNFRGNKAEDGLVRVEYWFERVEQPVPMYYQPSYDFRNCLNDIRIGTSYNNGFVGGTTQTPCFRDGGMFNYVTTELNYNVVTTPTKHNKAKKTKSTNDVGITVQGSKTKQDFVDGYTNLLEHFSSVIVIHLKGETHNGKVIKAMTVETKLKCPTCGRNSKSNAKWCYNCGTNLE